MGCKVGPGCRSNKNAQYSGKVLILAESCGNWKAVLEQIIASKWPNRGPVAADLNRAHNARQRVLIGAHRFNGVPKSTKNASKTYFNRAQVWCLFVREFRQ